MKRKNRVWDKTANRFFDENIHFFVDGDLVIAMEECEHKKDEMKKHYVQLNEEVLKTLIITQSIGRTDVNDEELFEDDLIEIEYEDPFGKIRKEIGVIKVQSLEVMLDFPQYGTSIPMSAFYTDDPSDFRKVGNYYQHEHLLKIGEEE